MGSAVARKNSQDTRRLTLDSALGLFTGKGYFNTSMQDIRREARVSIGSIYHHFKSKEALAKALYQDLLNRMEQMMAGIMERHQSTHDRARAVIAALFDMVETSPQAVQFILYAKHREFLPCEKPVCASRPFEMMRDMVSQGIERGEISDLDPVVATASLFGGAIRLIHLRLDGAVQGPLDRFLDQIWECAWTSVT